MSEPETVGQRRFVWPAEYYSGPAPKAVLPRGVTFGCSAAALVILVLVFAGGAFLASGGLVDFMDLVFGMSMGDLRGMYAADVKDVQKKELEESVEALRKNLREKKISVARLDPVLQSMRKAMADKKLAAAEVDAISAAARNASRR